MSPEQKQLIREKFEKWRLEWEGGATNHYASDKEIADFWLNELDLAIKQTEDRIVEKIQGMEKVGYATENIAKDNYGWINAELSKEDILYNKVLNSVITLIRNK